MYIGRFIVVSPTWAGYRVSSRSFPHRKIIDREGILTVVQTDDAPPTDNPYIAYNCVRVVGDTAVIGNGNHVDPIAEKIDLGYPVRDALALALLGLDFEKDDYDTPRIAGGVGESAWIGIIRRDGLIVEEVTEPTIVATYEIDRPQRIELEAAGAAGIARSLYQLEYEHPVCAAAVELTRGEVSQAIYNGTDG